MHKPLYVVDKIECCSWSDSGRIQSRIQTAKIHSTTPLPPPITDVSKAHYVPETILDGDTAISQTDLAPAFQEFVVQLDMAFLNNPHCISK